ncbi:MAG: hypothetical protein ACM30G_15115, partial [Micromonosporaceae bacterium]
RRSPGRVDDVRSRFLADRTLLIRAVVGLLALANLWWGVWARFAPRHFFDTFPGFGQHWTAAYPPFNEHLVTDLGSTFLTLGFLLAVAAVLDDRRVRAVVLAGVLIFNTLHLVFHASHPGTLGGSSLGASVTTLALGVVVPAALLLLDRPSRRS